jgi:ABC-2 type transport system ATP-binding protein
VDASLTVAPGEFIALVGRNGSGKTTLLKLSCGLLLPDSGTVTVEGISTMSLRNVRRHAGYAGTAERSFLGQLTAYENLEFFGVFEDIPAAELRREIPHLLRRVGLEAVADMRASKLSSGNLQRLSLGRALLTRPRLLLLDEPSRSLDPGGAAHLANLLKELQREGTSIVMSTHNIDEAYELADRVVVLDQGQITFVAQPGALANSAALRDLYSQHVRHPA